MKMTSQQHTLVKTSLAVMMMGLMATTAHALTPEQQELQQLRAELNALKATVQAQQQAINAKPAPVSMPTAKTASHAPMSLQTKRGAEVKLYGFVRGDAYYKLQGTDASSWGVWNDVAGAAGGNKNEKLNTTVATTRLGLEFTTPTEGHKVGGKVEADFAGNGDMSASRLRIRHAYLTYDNWLVGQTWSTYNDLNFLPEILDFNLSAGQGAVRTAMVRYENDLSPTTKYALAVERNSNADRAPNLVARVQQKFLGDKGVASVRGFVGEAYNSGADDHETAFGVAAGASYKLNEKVRVMADYNHVKGNSQYVSQVNSATGVDANGNVVANEFDSLSIGANYTINPKLEGAVGAGYIKAKDKGLAGNENVVQGFANIVYKPVPALGFGFEYIHGKAETFSGDSGEDQRVGATATYSF